jgi:hypothetical protein
MIGKSAIRHTKVEMITLKETFYERLDEFRDGYSFTEQDEAVRLLAVAGELLDLTFGRNEAPLVMAAVRKILEDAWRSEWDLTQLNGTEPDDDWRATWGEIDGWSASPMHSQFLDELHDLNAFANFGIMTIWSMIDGKDIELPGAMALRARIETAREFPGWVESICVKIDKLERLAPRNSDGSTSLNETLVTRNLARARVKFDQGQPLTIHELALLSGVTVKRIQNAVYAKTDEAPVVDRNGLISPEACETWLTARDYKPSIWKQVVALYPLTPGWGEAVPYEETEPDRIIDDFVFVPVANDGSMFNPSLRRESKEHEGGYTIGAKGGEHVVSTFDDALGQLRTMEAPRWRRPNSESGKWGIVTGQTWKRVRRAELEGLSQ